MDLIIDLETLANTGDRDECSFKHLAHGLAALLAGKRESERADYLRPADDCTDETMMDVVNPIWARLTVLRDYVGVQEFKLLLDNVQYPLEQHMSNAMFYIEMHHPECDWFKPV